MVDHYTDRDLRSAELKGDDYYRAPHVAQSCAVHGEFYVLLAKTSMHMIGPNDENKKLGEESELLVSHIMDLEGSNLFVYYSDSEPDIQRGGNYVGNVSA